MARAPGILAVTRFAFGESSTPDGDEHDALSALDQDGPVTSRAESYVRQLCGSCHLGARKTERGDHGELARGGGCTACHLAAPYAGRPKADGPLHPDVSAVVSERRCFGCHSRSGRIALSFHGVVELEPGDPRVTRRLADGRPVGAAAPDVHAKAGMTCIDCHTERELMGDGTLHRHAHEALDVSCEDCHQIAPRAASDPDREAVAQRLRASWGLRGLPPLPPGEPIRTRAGSPLWRTEAASGTLALVETGQRRRIPPASQAPHHELEGHARLSCQSCHTPWAPRCTSCHVRFDRNSEAVDHLSGQRTKGRWIETAGANAYGPPLLALGPKGKIVPFVEGMHLSVDLEPERPLRRDLWAPLDPHTTASARPCASCHDPARMDEVYPPRGELTRSGARLLDAAERAKIAKVGRCQSCHTDYDDPIWTDFAASNARLEGVRHGVGKADPKVRRCRAAAD